MAVKEGFTEVLAGSKNHPVTKSEIILALKQKFADRSLNLITVHVIDSGRFRIVCHLDSEEAVKEALGDAKIKIRKRENV